MMMSRRAKRMDRKHKRGKGALGINLVSLMDIFTILVFFLLVNSSDGEVLPSHKSVTLPESVSEEQPRQTLVIMVNRDNVLLHGEVLVTVSDLMNEQGAYSEVIKSALVAELARAQAKQRGAQAVKMEATIMGDREIPYRLLKKVMATATEAGYHRISLAVLQKPLEGA
jgi:biopolymer transport protein TolR